MVEPPTTSFSAANPETCASVLFSSSCVDKVSFLLGVPPISQIHPTPLRGLPPSFTRGNPRFSPMLLKSNNPDTGTSTTEENSNSLNGVNISNSSNCPGCSVDDGFVEVPLGANVHRPRNNSKEGSSHPPLVISDSAECLRDCRSKVQTYPLDLLDTNLDDQKTVPSCENEHFYPTDAVSEFLESHSDRQIELNLPSVEDGLSSGSELDTPRCDLKSMHLNGTVSNSTVRSAPHRGLQFSSNIRHARAQSSSPVDPYGSDSLVSPPLVRDIWGIVNDIKQTLADDRAIIDHSKEETSTASCSVNPKCESIKEPCSSIEARHSQQTALSYSRSQQNSKLPVSCDNPVSASGTCEKLTVRASVEECERGALPQLSKSAIHKNPSPSNKASNPTVYGSQEDLNPLSDRRTHHWTFPTGPSAVYSSSEEEDNMVRHKTPGVSESPRSGPTLSELASRTRMGESEKDALPNRVTAPDLTASNVTSAPLPKRPDTSPIVTRQSSPSEHPQFIPKRVEEFESDDDTDQLLQKQYQSDKPVYIPELKQEARLQANRKSHAREVSVRHPDFPDSLISGVLFHARYLGSTQLLSERQPTRNSRMYQAQEAVNRVKAPEGENQPNVPVELFISTERIMILNANLQEILIDHELRLVSYIADIGEIFVLMARRPAVQPSSEGTSPEAARETGTTSSTSSRSDSGASSALSDGSTEPSGYHVRGLSKLAFEQTRKPDMKLICHVLESSEARLIAQSVGHAFQLAYLDFLRESGVEDLTSVKHLNYQDVLNQQEIFCDELTMFTDKQRHKQITIPKQRGEPLGVVIVASGWGSLLPTALLANMNPVGPAARCGQLNIGNHIISVNDHSLVGLPLHSCQQIIKSCRNKTSVKLTVVDCPPVVEVLIRRPSLHYQLGFSVQDGVICSLLRGGIAERGGVRVDHRIIEINGESVVAVPHEKIVHLLATSVGEIHLRTMPTSVFRLLTGQDIPNYI